MRTGPRQLPRKTELGECDDFQPTSINMRLTSSEVSSYLPCCSSFAAVCCVYRHRLDQRVLSGHCGNRQCLGLLDERGQTLHQQLTVLDCILLSSLASSLHHQLLLRRLHTMGIERVHGDLQHHWLLAMLHGLGELVSGVRRNGIKVWTCIKSFGVSCAASLSTLTARFRTSNDSLSS